MDKFYGKIGFAVTSENPIGSGIWKETITERYYFGDIIRNSRRLDNTQKVNDDVNIGNSFSIVADAYAIQNFHAIRYVNFMGSNWKVTSIEVVAPRLNLTAGGLYNGQSPSGASSQT